MTQLTKCQTQHKIPAIREKIVGAAIAEAKTVTKTTTNPVATVGVTAKIAGHVTQTAAIITIVQKSSAHRLPAQHASMLRRN
jgi:hypothetical protein